MARKKKMWINNGIVYDPNIEESSPFDSDYEDNLANKKKFMKGKAKARRYFGV